MVNLLYTLMEWCIVENNDETIPSIFTNRELILESRKILDKIVVKMLKAEFENNIIINSLLKLSKMERIIIVLNIMNGVTLLEIAHLLNASKNSISVQKKTALEKLKVELSEHFHCGILNFQEVEIK